MMTYSQVEAAINTRLAAFSSNLVEKPHILYENQPLQNGKQFTPPDGKLWCRVNVVYGDSQIVGMGSKPCKRNFGMVQIQIFGPLNAGTAKVTQLCDAWESHLMGFKTGHLEIYNVHAPQRIDDDNFYGRLIRAEFRAN